LIVQQSFPLPELFNRLVARHEHNALVVDDFGGMAGVVTMEDAIETLLGQEIRDESDSDTDMRVRARKDWQKRAKARGLVQEVAEVESLELISEPSPGDASVKVSTEDDALPNKP
jgi:CBS domain containing-hemolysin-like protein